MLSALYDVIFRLMMVLFLSGLMEMILPEGSTRPFVRLVMGLVVLSICLEPFSALYAG